jgi:lipopolysaccharide transport system ATP-binding protein
VQTAIRVVDLSKRYQIGLRETTNGSFREMLVMLAKSPMRRLRHLSGSADDGWFWALRHVAFDVQQGEVMAVIGRNGAGKSTLLKILSRITEPTAGRIELRGRVASLLEVGTGFHPDLTGRENIFLNGAILGMRRAEIRRKFDAIVEFAEVARFIDTPVKHYSSGMYLRLAFSVAAHLDGEILVVDEVLAVGDVAFQQKCLGKLQDVSRGGRTVLFISHNMGAVSRLCSRAIVLDRGRPEFDGPAQEAVRWYLAHNLDDAAASWDLDALPRSNQDIGGEARLIRASAAPSASGAFVFGEPMRFRVALTSKVPLADLACVLNIDDSSGTRVVSFDSDESAGGFKSTGAGDYELELTVPPFGLRPDKYLLSASLYSGGHYYDYLVRFGVISVMPSDAQREHPLKSDRGPTFVPSTWRIVSAPEPARV